jgi:hypothetical protein
MSRPKGSTEITVEKRNLEMYREYLRGTRVEDLAEQYKLSHTSAFEAIKKYREQYREKHTEDLGNAHQDSRERFNTIRAELWREHEHATQPRTRINILSVLLKLEAEEAKITGLVNAAKAGTFNQLENIFGDEEKHELIAINWLKNNLPCNIQRIVWEYLYHGKEHVADARPI